MSQYTIDAPILDAPSLQDAERVLQTVRERHAAAQVSLNAAEEKRRALALDAAMGDDAAGKRLKAATRERDDAAQLVEGLDLAVVRARENVEAVRAEGFRSVAKTLCGEIADLGERRAALIERALTLRDELFAVWAEIEAGRDDIRRRFIPFHRMPLGPVDVASLIARTTAFLGTGTDTFVALLAATMPHQLFKRFDGVRGVPRDGATVVESERALWRQWATILGDGKDRNGATSRDTA